MGHLPNMAAEIASEKIFESVQKNPDRIRQMLQVTSQEEIGALQDIIDALRGEVQNPTDATTTTKGEVWFAADGQPTEGRAVLATDSRLAAIEGILERLGDVETIAGTLPVHEHPIEQVTGLVGALGAKAATAHSHAQADITGLTSALAGKAASAHGHTIADVSGLQAALDAKAAAGSLLGATVAQRRGTITLPLLNATPVAVTITFSTPFLDANYALTSLRLAQGAVRALWDWQLDSTANAKTASSIKVWCYATSATAIAAGQVAHYHAIHD